MGNQGNIAPTIPYARPTNFSFRALSSPIPQASEKTLEKDAGHHHRNG